MANIIKPKRSNTAAKVPTTSDLASGELGVNMADKKTYINNGTQVVQIGAGELSGLGDVSIATPSNGQSLAYNSTSGKWENSNAGAGDVVGPASATDNALVRFDGTTGKVIQNSTATLSDTGVLTTLGANLDYVQLDTTATETIALGKLRWNVDTATASFGIVDGTDEINIGEQMFAYVTNAESVAITRGQAVYLYQAQGNRATVKLANNTGDATSAKTLGLVAQDSIGANQTGFVITQGQLSKIDTSAYAVGATLYLGATNGALTTTKPKAPNHLVYIGVVERSNAGNGQIYVRPQNGYELDEIHDVQINSPANGQTIIYDASTSLWKNANLTAGTGISITNGAASITIANSAPDQVVSISGTSPVSVSGTYPSFTISMTQASGSVNGWLSSTDWNTFNNKGNGTVTSVSGTGGYGGLTLSGTVTSSGNITLGGTPTGTWPISVSGNAAGLSATLAVASGGTGATTGFKLFACEFTSNINANTNRTAGAYGSYAASATNTPTNSGILYNFTSATDGSGDGGQFWQDYVTNNLYLRQRWGGTYGSWLTIVSASNISSYAVTSVPAKMIYDTFLATAGQTTFTTSQTYTSGKIEVFVNGVKMRNGDDVTVTSGTSVVFASGLTLNDEVDLVYPI